MSHTFHVVSHTHWDREWYLTFQQFRIRLVDLIDNLLDLLERDPDFRSFHLDSQTIVLEDYLEIKPQNRERLEKHIRGGRIIIGPWYQLNDEFLTSGEATIRSLLLGMRIASQFGACGKTGYLPDQFGNLSQMPQIFRGFGFDHAIMGRGYQLSGERKMEFLWQSPDGSQVTASLMAFWYNNAQHFPADPREAHEYVESLRERMSAFSTVSHFLLMNGVDHLEAQQDLSPILKSIQQGIPEGDQIVHSTIEQYMEMVKKELAQTGIRLQVHSGELRDDRGGSCLAGTLSTRMYLKQANQHAQATLEKYAEPFSAFAFQVGKSYPQEFLQFAWKLLMKNHPHDSICGCSVDQVHREMMPRFAQVVQIGEELFTRSTQAIADRAALTQVSTRVATQVVGEGETGFVVFNSLNWARTDPVQVRLVFPLGIPTRGKPPRDDSQQVVGIQITDDEGKEIPFALTDMAVKMREVLSPVELPLDQWVQELTLEMIAADVPACGYKTYRVTPTAAMAQYPVLNKTADPVWRPVFEDCGDVGDEYLHVKPVNDTRLLHPAAQPECNVEQNTVRQTTTYTSTWALPAAADGVLARLEEKVGCHLITRVTRWRGIPRTEYVTTLENNARDHRVRVVFEKQDGVFHSQPYSIAEGQFDVIYRPFTHPLLAEGASPFHPQQSWVALQGLEGGVERTITVINQGLPEYEIYADAQAPSVAVTLLRSVNYLSRRGDGPEIVSPEAQCLGSYTFHYATLETEGDWLAGKVWQQSHQFNTPLCAVQTNLDRPGGQRDLPSSLSFLSVEPDSLVVTAIKRAEDDPNLLIVRFFNISDEPVQDGWVSVRNANDCYFTNLNEEIQSPLTPGADGLYRLATINPKEIITLGFKL